MTFLEKAVCEYARKLDQRGAQSGGGILSEELGNIFFEFTTKLDLHIVMKNSVNQSRRLFPKIDPTRESN
jgi:hypothetical protein